MKKLFVLFALLISWLLSVNGVAYAEPQIIMALEEPAANSTVSGVGNLRGWAVGSDGIDYVEYYVDGVLKKEIPYGAARGDIGNAYPGFPDSLYSGFSSAYAYGLLTPGTHVLKVRAVSSTGDYKEVSNTFEVTRFHKGYFPDPDAMDISSSSCSQDGTGFLLDNIKVEGTPYNARLEWQVPSQQFSIVEITDKPQLPATSKMSIDLVDSCDDGLNTNYKYYDTINNEVWPSSTTQWVTPGYDLKSSHTLECRNDGQVCLGARADTRWWGVDVDGSKSCDDCCTPCRTTILTWTIKCD